ncbi:DUF177 domain-containing protein [Neobacillus notoginsengisoli]|uniref:DUF177 domain-containing protein n=1 Tax=Neobacillus notoginsengisoli TaxID=1578198 RepID=A0A417YQJ4_9BACI|nr:YceD family protein [Neobacillus notoginsengisoli]RHW36517.1 DUF177 domain-containing protein [Neobacillus notoginsengisoli]
MKWTINQLQKIRNQELAIDETIRVDEIKEIDSTIREVSPIHITGRADIGATKVAFHIRINGHLILPCSRTLVDVNYPVDVETTETFLFNISGYETDEDAHQVKGDVVDLMPVIREILLLEVPMQVFCDDVNSEGAAPQSGKDWEVVTEESQSNKIDPRLADLAKFFDDNKSSDS